MVLEDLYRMVDQNLILVFPTEESARAFSVSYVLEREKGILASSVIAFDRFAEQFYHDGGTAEASDADKLIFASYASSRLGDKLRYAQVKALQYDRADAWKHSRGWKGLNQELRCSA